MTAMKNITKYLPVALAFGLVGAGTWTLLPEDSNADAEAGREVVVLTRAMPEGTKAEELLRWVTTRSLPGSAVVDGAYASIDDIADGVLTADHAAGQQITNLSIADNRVAAVGPDYLVTSVQLPAQNWTGAVRIVGSKVDVYRLAETGVQVVSRGAVVLDAPAPDEVQPSSESILTIAVRRDSLADVLLAARDGALWLVGQ